MKLKVRGKNLLDGVVTISPAANLTIDAQPAVDELGGEMTLNLQIEPLANAGLRTMRVTTPFGQTTADNNISNSLTLVRQIQQIYPSIMAPAVGVLVGTQSQPPTSSTTMMAKAQSIGVTVGSHIRSVTPKALIRNTTTDIVVNGSGFGSLQNVTLTPSTSLSLGTYSVNGDGTQVTIPVAVDASAEKTIRRLSLRTATGTLPFTEAHGDQLLVSDPIPEVAGVAPQVMLAGVTTTLRINGVNLGSVTGLRFEPAADITLLSTPQPNAAGTVITADVSVSSTATSGVRTVIVQTAAGESSTTNSLNNSVYVARQIGAKYDSIMAPLVGVVVQSNAPPATTQLLTFAPLVGIYVPTTPASVSNSFFVASQPLVVAVGTVVTGMIPAKPEGILQGDTLNVVFTGQGLDQITTAHIYDAAPTNANSRTVTTAISLGALAVNAEGTRLTVPVTVSNAALAGSYKIALDTGTDINVKRAPALPSLDMILAVGAIPTVNSMSPIVMEQGKSYSLVIRGSQMQGVFEVWADAASGVEFITTPVWSSDTFGELITVNVAVKLDAALGSRVIRLRVPGGSSTATPTSANTITVFPVQ
jgi:hypothetical protein